MSRRDTRLALAWYTVDETTGATVRLSLSKDGGASFASPVAIDPVRPIGRVAVAIRGDGSTVVGWIAHDREGAVLNVRAVSPSGELGEALGVAAVDPSRASGFPTLAIRGDVAVVAWTDVADETKRVRTALVTLP